MSDRGNRATFEHEWAAPDTEMPALHISKLAWKLAKMATLRTPSDGGVIAEFVLPTGGALYGEGNTWSAAIEDLAGQLDRWGRDA